MENNKKCIVKPFKNGENVIKIGYEKFFDQWKKYYASVVIDDLNIIIKGEYYKNEEKYKTFLLQNYFLNRKTKSNLIHSKEISLIKRNCRNNL